MSSSFRNIAIIGPTSKLGSYILTSLHKNLRFKTTIITRDNSPSTFPPHPNERIIKAPSTYPEPGLLAVFRNQDALIISLPVSTRKRIGDAVAAILTPPEETKKKIVHVNFFMTSQNEVLVALENTTGKKRKVERVGKEMLREGNIMGIRAIMKSIPFVREWGRDFEGEGIEVMNEMQGLEREGLDWVIREVLKEFE